MSLYTLSDIQDFSNVRVLNSSKVSRSYIISFLYKVHNSKKINSLINIPLKSLWFYYLFAYKLKDFIPDYVVLSTTWYSENLLHFLRKRNPNCKILLRFTDKVENSFGGSCFSEIEKIAKTVDGVMVYSKEDENKFGFNYYPVGYSVIKPALLKSRQKYDVVFIGANKGRIESIREAYLKFVGSGLSCFFYVTGVEKYNRKNDGIHYSDNNMSFLDYLSYEISSKCIFELVQEGSSGKTYRLVESVIYNKLLITNCSEIKNTAFYDKKYVQLFDKVSDIDPLFVKNCQEKVDYKYNGEFSPVHELKYIEKNWAISV